MKIPRKGVEEYRELIKRKYSLNMSYAEAEEGFRDLLSLFQVIYQPIENFDRNGFSEYNKDSESHEKR